MRQVEQVELAGEEADEALKINPNALQAISIRAALELLSGQDEVLLNMPFARLTREFKHRSGITRFLPARLSEDGASVTPVAWHGSGDIPAITRANAYLVADPECPVYESGAPIRVLSK